MASHRVLNQNDRLAYAAVDGFRMLDELYSRPPPPAAGRRVGAGWVPPQYPYEFPYYDQQPRMGFGNQVIYPREQHVISSVEAAQFYGGVLLNDLPRVKSNQKTEKKGKGFTLFN